MTIRRKVEIFSAGCPLCEETIDLVNQIACPSCQVTVLNMRDKKVFSLARALNVKSVPAVAVDGKLAECCAGRGADEKGLKAAGVGQPID